MKESTVYIHRAVEAQLEQARERAAAIPALEARLAELETESAPTDQQEGEDG